MESPSFKIDKVGFKKVGKGLLIGIGGAILTYIAEVVLVIDFGGYTPIVVAGASAIVNFGRKFLASY